MSKPLILLANDDGVNSEGLHVLWDALSELGEIVTVAPRFEQSAASHAITIRKPIKVEKLGDHFYAVHGTPADCIVVAVYGILERRPDIVVSGINLGYNLGEDVIYSGTVAAAREAALMGISALAVSIGDEPSGKIHWESAAYFAYQIVKSGLEGTLRFKLLNLNVPNRPLDLLKGLKFVKLGNRNYKDPVEKLNDGLYLIGGEPLWDLTPDTDQCAVKRGFASCTPLRLDFTDHEWLLTHGGYDGKRGKV